MAVLANTWESSRARLRHWADALAQSGFDAAGQYVSPEESRLFPELALRARLNVLLRVYNYDYHTDAFDFERLARTVAEGSERIAFWGDEDSVGALRGWAKARRVPSEAELDGLGLGTATVLDVAAEHGAGYAEMCRTGSVSTTVAANGAVLTELLSLFDESSTHYFSRHHTFLSVPRNRVTTAEVRGGAAIQRLHVREVGSCFWGVAPWHLMQGGSIEVLDYRELYRRHSEAVAAAGRAEALYFSAPEQAQFVASLLRLNFGEDFPVPPLLVGDGGRPARNRWTVRSHAGPELVPFNPAFVWPDAGGTYPTLEEADADPRVGAHACVNVVLPLEDAGMVHHQRRLDERGYRLASLIPPKREPGGAADAEQSPPSAYYGVWSKVRRGLPLARPFYLGRKGHSAREDEIIAYLSDACGRWEA